MTTQQKRKVTLNKWVSPNGNTVRIYVNNAFEGKTLYFVPDENGKLQFELTGNFPSNQEYHNACNRVREYAAKYGHNWETLLATCEQQEEQRKEALQYGVDVTGNSYPVRSQLHDMGCKWDKGKKVWVCPQDVAEEAQALVDSQPEKKTPAQPGGQSSGTCKGCGGYHKIGRSGLCRACYYSDKDKAPF